MPVDLNELKKHLAPVPNYEDLGSRLVESTARVFVREHYRFTMPQVAAYTRRLLGEDSRKRYDAYVETLVPAFEHLHAYGVADLISLVETVGTLEQLEAFTDRTGAAPAELIHVLRYLLYWVLPKKVNLRELVEVSPEILAALTALRQHGVRSNLDLLDQGRHPDGRVSLAQQTGLPAALIIELVNRADFTRVPYTRGAVICNIINAGYPSLSAVAAVDLPVLLADLARYGEKVGKNMKLGVEGDSLHRIARLLPRVVEQDNHGLR